MAIQLRAASLRSDWLTLVVTALASMGCLYTLAKHQELEFLRYIGLGLAGLLLLTSMVFSEGAKAKSVVIGVAVLVTIKSFWSFDLRVPLVYGALLWILLFGLFVTITSANRILTNVAVAVSLIAFALL